MGSVSIMQRAGRFIKEFNDDVKERGYEPGTWLKITAVFLAQEDSDNGSVRSFIRLQDDNGKITTLTEELVLFDPDCDNGDDLVKLTSVNFGISESEARRRLKKAKLLD